MNSNIGIAKELVRISRIFVAFNRNKLEKQLKKKRSDLDEKCLKKHLDCLEKMDAKERKVALYWIGKKTLTLPEDLGKFNDAMNLINKQHLDFQKFDDPMKVLNRDDKSTIRIKSQDSYFSPSTEKAFSNPYNAGEGVVIYDVDDSIVGQLAVRKAIDVNWGYGRNPWCIATRKSGFNQNEISALSPEQAEKLGFYSNDALAVAWRYWNRYKAYPKRIAFKNGKLFAFSAGRHKQHVEWWDKDDKQHYIVPESNAVDDIEFLKKHGKLNLLDSNSISHKLLEKLTGDKEVIVRQGVAEHPKTPVKLLKKLANDKDGGVRQGVAMNPNAPVGILKKLAGDESSDVRKAVARNPNTPVKVLTKLATENDEEWGVREAAINNFNTPAEALRKLAEDKDDDVRWEVTHNPNAPADILNKLAGDEYWLVREGVAKNPSTPVGILKKLSNDKDKDVRKEVAKNSRTPVGALTKLVKDKDWLVRYRVAENHNTPVEALKKLADDEFWKVREIAESRLRRRGQSF